MSLNPSKSKAILSSETQWHKDFGKKYLNPVLLVFIEKLSLRTVKWVPMCQGFSQFLDFLHHFVLAKLATSSIKAKLLFNSFGYTWEEGHLRPRSSSLPFQKSVEGSLGMLRRDHFRVVGCRFWRIMNHYRMNRITVSAGLSKQMWY